MEVAKYNNFKYTRLWKGLTVVEMARILGISTATVSAVENGYRPPTPEIRATYARKFPINYTYFEFIEAYEKTGS